MPLNIAHDVRMVDLVEVLDAGEPRHGIEWENPQLFSVFVARKTMAPLTYLDCKILA